MRGLARFIKDPCTTKEEVWAVANLCKTTAQSNTCDHVDRNRSVLEWQGLVDGHARKNKGLKKRLRELQDRAHRAEAKAEGCVCIICRDRNKRARVKQLLNENKQFAKQVLETLEADVLAEVPTIILAAGGLSCLTIFSNK